MLIGNLVHPDVDCQSIDTEQIIYILVLAKIHVVCVAGSDIKHANVTNLDFFFRMRSMVPLAGVTLGHHFLDVGVHASPEYLPAELVHHHLLPEMSLMCYLQYFLSLSIRNHDLIIISQYQGFSNF